jgi:hypothetical protein
MSEKYKELVEKLEKVKKGYNNPTATADEKAIFKGAMERIQRQIDELKEEAAPEPKEAPKVEKKKSEPKKEKVERAPNIPSMTYEKAMEVLKKDPERLKKDCETILAKETVRKEHAKESQEKYENKSAGSKIVGAGERLADGIAREAKKVDDKKDLRKLVVLIQKLKSIIGEAKEIIQGSGLSKAEQKELDDAISVVNKYVERKKK